MYNINHFRMKAVVFLIFLILVVAVDGKKYCGQQYDRMVAMTCRFGKESTPCLGPARQGKNISDI